MRKSLACILTGIFLLPLILGGLCGCSDNSLLDPDDPLTLTIWHVYGEQADAPMNLLIEEFNETVGREKGIRVQVTNVTGTSKILAQLTDAQAGKPGTPELPDLFSCHTQNAPSLGIDNLLLPGKRKVPFARRRDLAQADGAYDEGSQAARADLKWAIDDAAIDIVNMHLDGFIEGEGVHSGLEERSCPAQSRFLVIDELGRLELLAGGGLTSALALLDRGATPMFPHALAVVRESLLDAAFERFAETLWNGMRAISPDARGEQLLLEAFECEP